MTEKEMERIIEQAVPGAAWRRAADRRLAALTAALEPGLRRRARRGMAFFAAAVALSLASLPLSALYSSKYAGGFVACNAAGMKESALQTAKYIFEP